MKKKVLILGSSSGIGIDIIKIFLKNNFEIIAHYNKGNQNFFNFLKKNDINKIKFNFSTDLKKIENFSKNKLFSKCDVLINAIGQIKEIDYEKISSSQILDSIKVNLIPGIIFTKNIGIQMNGRKWGRIVHLGSIGVKFGGGEKNFAYSLSKHALEFFPSKSKKWIKNNVLMNTVRVGLTDTKIHKKLPTKNLKERIKLIPMKRMAATKEIAKLIYFLGSDENSFISNEVITIAGGE